MAVTIHWYHDTAHAIESFTIQRSIDGGRTFAALAVVVFDLNGANYDRATNRFRYRDLTGAPGYVYSVVVTGELGLSDPAFVVAPPAPAPLCTVIGYTSHVGGARQKGLPVVVEYLGDRQDQRSVEMAGTIGMNKQAVVVGGTAQTQTDANGMWSIDLVQGARVLLTLPGVYSHAFTVPKARGPVNVRDLPQIRGTSINGSLDELGGIPVGLDGT